ncbi:MAG: T9SS type A sorting domain-containing protein [Saprospiraceae bacterium]
MKRLNTISILMAIACLLLSFQTSYSQNSADCQSEVNLSVGAGCTTSIPFEAFNSWRPSCMVINQDGVRQGVLAGSGSFANGKVNCSMMIDSVWLDTIKQTKINSYLVSMWTISCTGATPDTIYADLSKIPALCNADTLVRDVAGVGTAQPINGRVVLNSSVVPTCKHSNRSAIDGDLIFVDTVETLTFKQHVKKVMRVDTFSHTEPMKWIRGTVILNLNGMDSIVHGFTPKDGKKTTLVCGGSFSLSSIFGTGILPGPAVLKPGKYEYNSYTPDSSNYCWGTLNIEYKLWPFVASKKDTISCVDVTNFDRSPEGGHYDYKARTVEKLEEVCAWAEKIYTGSTQRQAPTATVPGIGALRSAARIAYVVNGQVRHCYVHTITTQDRYIKDFNWLCDTVVKERTFIADRPAHNGGTTTGVIVKDTLMITPITLDDVMFPDSVLTMKCGILDGYTPDEIAEYLYKAYLHFDHTNVPVITGVTRNGVGKGYITQGPCEAFATQYNMYGLSLSKGSSLSKNQLWEKVFKGADYNNWGVQRAFPYAIRKNKLTDYGLKNKLDILIKGGDVAKSSGFKYGVDSVLIPINRVVCNIAASHLDLEPIIVCGGEKKIYRQWSLVDWCTGTTREKTQIIKFVDIEAPSITGFNNKSKKDYFSSHKVKIASLADSARVKVAKITSPWGCYAQYQFPYINLKEHCSEGKYSFKLLTSTLVSDGTTYYPGQSVNLSWTSEGGFSHPVVQVYLYDDCGNSGSYYYYLRGKDALPPVIVVHDEINLTLTADKTNGDGLADGIAKIFCDNIDAGSHDGDCGDIAYCKIRIKDSGDDWSDFIHFDCDDVGQHTVEFQATDESGNQSIGWTLVNVEIKLSATLVCEDLTVGCTDPVHPDWIGFPHVAGICSIPDLVWEDEYQVDDLCFKGKILRTWTIENSSPKITCVQTIYINNTDNGGDDSKFDPKTIKFPLHHTGQTLADAKFNKLWVVIKKEDAHNVCRDSYTATDKDLKECTMRDAFICEIGNATEPTWTDPKCGLVGKTFEDQVIEFGEGVCHKILRHWAVIDWCTYDAKKGDVYKDEVEYVKDLCKNYNYFRLRGTIQEDGYYSYTQEIKILDDEAPNVETMDIDVEVTEGGKNSENECVADVMLMAKAQDFCGGTLIESTAGIVKWSVSVTEVDEYGNAVGPTSTDYTIAIELVDGYAKASITLTGEAGHYYRVKWTAKDGCNNTGSKSQLVRFLDVKAPVILCIGELSTSTMNTDGSTEIWANDFAEAYDCLGKEAYVWFKGADGALVPGLRFECSDLGGNASTAIRLKVYATDEAGNESFCLVSLRIIDGNNTCGNDSLTGAAIISGEVRTEAGDMVESAVVSMKDENVMTSTDGTFAFGHNPTGFSYEINAVKSDNHLNGVSTLDLVLIQKHILGLETLSSPYKIIAADINSDEKVSAIDLVQLRKLILGIYDELPDNQSWRFVDATSSFDDVNHPFPFTETVNVDFLTHNVVNEDFIAVKIGDVSGNAIANSLLASGRNNEQITLTAQDITVNVGQRVRVAISSEEFEHMNALQFTMGLSGLEYVGVESGSLDISENNIAVFEGRITAAWYNVEFVSSDATLFTLIFNALDNTTLSNALSIGSDITKAIAYNNNNVGADVALAFETGDGLRNGETFELFQNQPNPFNNITTIGFQLAEAGTARMTVFDVTGQIVTTMQGQYSRGYNEMTLSKSNLNASGVLYYQLESGDFTATRKMILID